MLPILLAITGLTPVQAASTFTAARASDGEPVAGTVSAITAGFGVTFAGGPPAVASGDLLTLARSDKPRPAYPAGPQVILANGDRLAGTLSGGNGLSLTLKATAGNGQSVSLPLTALAAAWFIPPTADTPADVAKYPWLDTGKKQDVLLLRNGDALRGRLESVGTDAATVRFKPDGEKAAKPYETANLAAVLFDPSLARVRPPKGAFARVVTADGSRISFATLLSNAEVVTGTTLTGAKMGLPLAELIAVDIRGGKGVELTDLKPTAVKEEGFNGTAWPMTANRSVRGNPIKLLTARGEEVFDAGLGVHSRSTLTYSLSGKYKRFEAVVGLDAATGKRGAVDVRVLVDGKEVWSSRGSVKGGEPARPIGPIDVTGASELLLEVGFGGDQHVLDRADWVEPILVRAK